MEIKILQVFYGKDGLPYKDKDRQVHFPITGTGFLGASNTTKIKFYYDELDNLDETTWVAVSKLPNGRVGSRVLESYLDEELNEHYALLELDNYYTQYKGDVFISLQGYQGGVDFDYDEENSQYEIHGTPTIAATGSIKFTINYANQFVGSGETDNINFQRILAALGTKLGIRAYSEHVQELPSEGSPDVFYVINDDSNDPTLQNIYVWNENTRHYVWVGDNKLDLNDYYTKEQGNYFESSINNRIANVENEIDSVANGSPKGAYDSVEELTTAHPNGDSNIYLVGTHWYYWNGTAWTDGGEYLSSGEDVERLKEEMENLWVWSANVYNKETDTVGKYIDTSGVLQDNTNFSTSDFIDIPFDGDNYMYINAQNVASEYNDYKGIYSYALYDENKTFISRSAMVAARITGFNNSTNHAKYIRIVVGKNTNDLMVTFKNTYDSSYDPTYIPYGGEIAEKLENEIKVICEETCGDTYDSITENKENTPLKHLIYNGGMTNIFRTIGVVGDSLASGCMEKSDQTGIDMYEYSWIQTIGRLCGSTAFNFSVGGLSSKNFWTTNNAYVKHLRDKDANYKCQAYFIALGVNDIADTSIDVGTASDIDNDESTTFYGYYSRIIKLIQEVQPRAKIFLVGLPNHPAMTVWGSRFTNFKNAIADMVNHFDNCYYLNLFTYDVLYDNDFRAIYFNGFHENALGYLRSAWVISSYVDWIIRHNYEDFREVAFIGTNYHYYTE